MQSYILKLRKYTKSPINLAILFHFCNFGLFYTVLLVYGYIDSLPNNQNLGNWDVEWYSRIKDFGYFYKEGANNTMAFFPLFPFLWDLIGLGNIGISLLNLLLFYISFYFLANHLKLDFRSSLLFLSTPSLFFCFVPYSESLFFLGTSMILIGLDKDKPIIIIMGILIAASTRSIAPILSIPIIFAAIFQWKRGWRPIIYSIFYCSLLFFVTLLVFYVQYLYTGKWWVFFEVQKSWNRDFRIPVLPFTTLSETRMLWLDGLALIVAEMAFIVCVVNIYKFFKSTPKYIQQTSYLFASVYLTMVGIVGIFYSGQLTSGQGTSLYSLNRFIFCSPFYLVFLSGILRNQYGWTHAGIYCSVIIITWCMIGCFGSKLQLSLTDQVLYFGNLTIYAAAYLFLMRYNLIYYFLCSVNLLLQVFLFNQFIHGQWVG